MIPKVQNTHVYVDPADSEQWMIVIRSQDDAPTHLTCIDEHGNTHQWVRDVERSLSVRRMIIDTRHLHENEGTT